MRRGFTMIEMIFVIVIVGILASVALPRLSATRDDAIDARDCKNLATCVTDLMADYTARGVANPSSLPSCVRAQASNKNSISLSINSSTKDLTVTGAPTSCRNLNNVFHLGGTRVRL